MARYQDDTEAGLEAIERLAGRGGGTAGGLTPNDVLVQIALPLVLILAIATRLITMGQAMTDRERSAMVLDLWKQQLILRMEKVLTRWEQDAALPAFPAARRIDWQAGWPADDRFQLLCRQAQALENMESLAQQLYREALQYVPPEGETAGAGAYFPLYDPALEETAPPEEGLHEDLIMNAERRAFALDYLGERCLRWQERILTLQWEVVARVVAELPPDDPLSEGQISLQMRRISEELAERGVPLLSAVAAAYGE